MTPESQGGVGGEEGPQFQSLPGRTGGERGGGPQIWDVPRGSVWVGVMERRTPSFGVSPSDSVSWWVLLGAGRRAVGLGLP